jgi:hypothetical protein
METFLSLIQFDARYHAMTSAEFALDRIPLGANCTACLGAVFQVTVFQVTVTSKVTVTCAAQMDCANKLFVLLSVLKNTIAEAIPIAFYRVISKNHPAPRGLRLF